MSDKIKKELTQGMNMLEGLKYTEQIIDEREYKKHWGLISVPLTLHEGLSTYKKTDLDDIRKYLDIKNASSLKKSELSALIGEKIPDLLKSFFLRLDYERFNLLLKIARNGGYIESSDLQSDQINYLRASGIVFTGTFNDQKILAVPEELVKPILTLGTDVGVRSTIKRNTDWVKLTRGLVYYYGVLSTTELEEMVAKHTNETVTSPEFSAVIHDAMEYRKDFRIDMDGYSNSRVLDSEQIAKEHALRKNLPYYPFTKNDLLTAGEPEFADRNESYLQLISFILNQYDIEREQAEMYAEECVYAIRMDYSLNDILQYLGGVLEIKSMKDVQGLTDKIVHMMNNTRKWILKGHTSMELSPSSSQPLPNTTTKASHGPIKKKVKVGRNDPCPCGSGKKYKKCCGR